MASETNIGIGFRAAQDTANKLMRIASHNGIIRGGISEGIRIAVDIAYRQMQSEMSRSTKALVYKTTKRTPLKTKK